MIRFVLIAISPFSCALRLSNAGSPRGGQDRDRVRHRIRLNHTLLPQANRDEDWFHFQVPVGVAHSGMNEVGRISNIPAACPFAGLIGPPNADSAEFLKQAFGRVNNVIPREQDPVVVPNIYLEISYPAKESLVVNRDFSQGLLMDGLSLQKISELFGLHSALEHQGSLLSLGLLIIVAKLTEGVFRRLRLKSIVAYATAGMLLGPVLK